MLARNWRWMLPAVVFAGLGLALVLARAESRHWRKIADSRAQQIQLEQAKHSITRASLDQALAAIDDQNAAVQKLRADGDVRAKAANDALAGAQRAAERSDGIAAQLRASAGKAGSGERCAPSEALWTNRGEL